MLYFNLDLEYNMVFMPETTRTDPTETHLQQNQSFLAPQPVYKVVQSPTEYIQPPNNVQQPISTNPLSSTTTNDEIGELLVAILEEIGHLKEAILSDTNDDVEKLLEHCPEQKSSPTSDAKQDMIENRRVMDFSGCF